MTFVCHFPFHFLSSKSKPSLTIKNPTIMLPSKPDKRSKTFSAFNCVDKKRWANETLFLLVVVVIIVCFVKQPEKFVFGEIYENFIIKWTFESFSFHQTKKERERRKDGAAKTSEQYLQAYESWCDVERAICLNQNEILIIKWNLYLSFAKKEILSN